VEAAKCMRVEFRTDWQRFRAGYEVSEILDVEVYYVHNLLLGSDPYE
jgi:hypothetical protein